jgi:hypothetical protein
MNKRILVSQEEKNSILSMHESFKNRGVIKEDEMGMDTSKQCTFTISSLLKSNKQKLTAKTPSSFQVVEVNGSASVKAGSSVSTNQTIKMSKGSIVFKDITDYGQATITCDGTTATINVQYGG